ncbi:MAG: hypothetical protein CGW95_16940 [Phenylobacterium zucineum]|nr:MAG: hypothetical protein CGW95_16940 [Phenylobacterium zucineum]
MVYEARKDDDEFRPKLPKGNFEMVITQTIELWEDLEYKAKEYRLDRTSQIDLSFCMSMYRWASGARLDTVLNEADLLAGDFIRWSKQVIDLLDQIAQCATGSVADNAKNAIDKVKRGIVAYSYYTGI